MSLISRTFVADGICGIHNLLGAVWSGEKTGIYEVSIFDRKCISLLPGVVTFNTILARDGKSFLYAVASGGEVTIYRLGFDLGGLDRFRSDTLFIQMLEKAPRCTSLA